MVSLIYFFLFSIGIQAQDNIPVENYHKRIFNAEKHIIEEDYCSAASEYLKLCDTFYIWNGDLHNALLSSLLCDDNLAIDRFITLFIERGTTIDYLETKFKDFVFFKSTLWETMKKKEYIQTYSSEIQVTIDSMHTIDQKGNRCQMPGSKRIKRDFSNLVKLYDIIEEFGYPTERELGFINRPDSVEFNNLFKIVLIHLVKLQPWEFGNMLTELYFENKIPASEFIYLFAHTKSCDDIQLSCFPFPPTNALFVDNVMFTCNYEERKRINRNREKYYLDSVEDQLKKIKFVKQSPYHWFLGEGTAVYSYGKKYTFESFTKKLMDEGLVPYSESN